MSAWLSMTALMIRSVWQVMNLKEFRKMLSNVDRSYDGFVSLVMAFVKMPGNSEKGLQIRDYILSNPCANSSDVLRFMITEQGLIDVSG